MIESQSKEDDMSLTVEAIYEGGVLKLLTPLAGIGEHERVLLTVQKSNVVDGLRSNIKLDPKIAQEIIESADYSVLES
jgi:predicted DNA-binding antitoxin AbrB/MazE fold protein